MADEFAKGLGLAAGAGLIWMVLAGWYRTPSFDSAQLGGEIPDGLTGVEALAPPVMEAMFWLAVLGMIAFWVVIPAGREIRERIASEE